MYEAIIFSANLFTQLQMQNNLEAKNIDAMFAERHGVIPWAVRNELDSTPQICVQFIIFA